MHGRLITDNVLIAFETMHHIRNKKTGKVGEMTLKFDMSKAYDRVEWGCLEKIMEKLSFDKRWRGLVMRCVRSVTYFIKINGSPRGHIIPSRGKVTLYHHIFSCYVQRAFNSYKSFSG